MLYGELREKYLAIGDVCRETTLGKSCIYEMIRAGDFPKPRQLTRGRVAWLSRDVDAWMQSRPTVAGANAVGA